MDTEPMTGPSVTNSGDSSGIDFTADDVPSTPAEFGWFDDHAVDGEVISDSADEAPTKSSRLKSATVEPIDRKVKSGMPDVDEWLDFFSRVVIRLATDFYIELAFRGVDDDDLSEREVDKIALDQQERDRIGRPFAEFSVKNKFMKKHGRSIIASADSIDALIQLGMWVNRVNRIAAKYRRLVNRDVTRTPRIRHPHVASRAQRTRHVQEPVIITPEDQPHERTQSRSAATSRPDINGIVYNPGSN